MRQGDAAIRKLKAVSKAKEKTRSCKQQSRKEVVAEAIQQELTMVNSEVKYHNGIMYEKREKGLFQGKLASWLEILKINRKDYVEYCVLLKRKDGSYDIQNRMTAFTYKPLLFSSIKLFLPNLQSSTVHMRVDEVERLMVEYTQKHPRVCYYYPYNLGRQLSLLKSISVFGPEQSLL